MAYLDGVRTGLFEQDSRGSITFTYDDDISPDATPISVSMPLIPGARYKNQSARPFLQGLLPDNDETLGSLARTYGTSAANPMALLEHVGRDTAGAVQLLPPGTESDDAATRTGALADIDLDQLVADIVADAGEWMRNRDEMRWSLAGAQPKAALHKREDGSWAIPLDSTPTTHVVKPAARGTRHDLNEFVTMRAARHLGLDVADHEILTTGRGDHVFVSRRYDRARIDGTLHRLHQEDFAQALGVEPSRKYQADGGPGVMDFARVLNAFPVTAQPPARLALFDALVFTVASMNTDAHAKNYSIVHYGRQMRLAPLYDLGTNVLYDGRSPVVSAVTIGGERAMDRIGIAQFVKVARTLGVDADEAEGRLHRIQSGVADAFLQARDDARAEMGPEPQLDEIVEGISDRARRRGWIT